MILGLQKGWGKMPKGVRTTISVPMISKWKCSACGAENAQKQNVTGYGYGYDEFSSKRDAQKDLEKTWKNCRIQLPATDMMEWALMRSVQSVVIRNPGARQEV